MKKISLNVNMILYAINSMMGVIFPLITFPYVSNVLGVENLGKYNFSVSVISYILLFARLGISFYAVREGARIREDAKKIKEFTSQIFSLNVVSTVVSYSFFIILLFLVPKFKENQLIMLLLSIQVLFVPIEVEWIYRIYENFLYVTIRNVAFQIFSLLMLFLFVKTVNDLVVYVILTVVSSVGSSILNFIYARKYTKMGLVRNIEIRKHLKPVVLLFAMNIAGTIFSTSDIVMLGFISGDRAVGLYSVAVKVYTMIKVVASSPVAASIPRISSYLGEGKEDKLKKEVQNIFNILMTLSFPITVGGVVLCKEIVLSVSNETYLDAALPLSILSVDIVINLIAFFWGQIILIPFKKDKELLKITVFCAALNIILNVVLIPYFHETAAATATLFSEIVWMFLCRRVGQRCYGKIKEIRQILKVAVGCLPIVLFAMILKSIFENMYSYIIVLILLSGVSYCIVELLLKNEVFVDIFNKIKRIEK